MVLTAMGGRVVLTTWWTVFVQLVPLSSFSWQMATAVLWVFGVPEIQRPKTSQLTRILRFRLAGIATFLVMESPVTHK